MTVQNDRWRAFAALSMILSVAGCASTETAAPILDRSPRPAVTARKPVPAPAAVLAPKPAAATQPKRAEPVAQAPAVRPSEAPVAGTAPARAEQPVIRPYREGDWRPEYYVVQKGDTLYSIALDYGQDYRDLAAWNRLADPSYIQVGQQLRMFPPGSSGEGVALEPVELPPARLSAPSAVAQSTPKAVPVFTEPKARRLEYSDQALAQLLGSPSAKPSPATAAATPSPPAKPATVEPPKSVQVGIAGLPDERLTWEWPVPGPLIYAFGKGTNQKGIGLDGKLGQPVVAAAPGKVVYAGSGLRGYGKLVIIKHNASYLSVYAHNSQLLVKEGQSVAQGQKIAEMGESDSDRVSLHFEIRRLGKPTDPLKYLPEKPS